MKVSTGITVVLSCLALCCLAWLGVYLWWMSAPVASAAAKSLIRNGQPLVIALHSYQQDMGAFPESLDELVPDYIDNIPNAVHRHKWHYKQMDNGHFQLSTTFMNWVSTWDVLVLRSDGVYPDDWRAEHTVFEHGPWRHIIGAQNIDGLRDIVD